jgi:hypothetical protein
MAAARVRLLACSYRCAAWCAEPSLLSGKRRHQFAAEGEDVRYHAAPDHVGSGRETSEYVSDGHLGRSQKSPPPPAGVLTGVALEAREEPKAGKARVLLGIGGTGKVRFERVATSSVVR